MNWLVGALSPNQVLTHAARAAAKQLNHLWWPLAWVPQALLLGGKRREEPRSPASGRARRARRALVRARPRGAKRQRARSTVNCKGFG